MKGKFQAEILGFMHHRVPAAVSANSQKRHRITWKNGAFLGGIAAPEQFAALWEAAGTKGVRGVAASPRAAQG